MKADILKYQCKIKRETQNQDFEIRFQDYGKTWLLRT